MVAFKGPNVILGLHKCDYSLTVNRKLGAAARSKQGAGLDKTRLSARFGLWALCLPPVFWEKKRHRDRHRETKGEHPM